MSAASTAEAVPRAGERQNPSLTLAILAVSAVAFSLLQSAVVPALPTIQHALHTNETGATWLMTGYLLAATIATPIIGRLGDMLGKQHVLVWTMGILAVGTLLSAVATSVGVMIVGRVIQGAGGGVFPLAFGIIRDEFPREKVAEGIGFISALLGIGGAVGVVMCGVIVQSLSISWLFWIPFAVIVVATVLSARFIPESPVRVPGSVNWAGATLMTVGLSAVLLAISETTTWGWGSPRTLGLLAIGLGFIALWVVSETRSRSPLVDMRMMRLPGVWTTNLAAFLLGGGMYTSFIVIPQFVELPRSTGFGLGASVLESGIFLLPSAATMLFTGSLTGRIAARFGSKAALIIGSLSTMACFALLAIDHSAAWCFYLASGFLGLGIGLAYAALGNLIVHAVPPGQTGVATGMNTVARTLGGALGAQVAATFIVDSVGRGGLPAVHGFELSFIMAAGVLAFGVLASARVPGAGPARRRPGVGAPQAFPASTRTGAALASGGSGDDAAAAAPAD